MIKLRSGSSMKNDANFVGVLDLYKNKYFAKYTLFSICIWQKIAYTLIMKTSTKKKLFCIYLLTFPNDKKYVGLTCNFRQRWHQHVWGRKFLVDKKIKQYYACNINIVILHNGLTLSQANIFERIEIVNYNCLVIGGQGYNILHGGGSRGMFKHSAEARAKMIAKHKGMTGKKHSTEARAKMSIAHKGKRSGMKASAETRAKMRAAQKGRKGLKLSAETRAKISAAKKGRKIKKHSVEHRTKISASIKLYLAKLILIDDLYAIDYVETGEQLSSDDFADLLP